MASTHYNDVSRKMRGLLQARFENPDSPKMSFATAETAEKVLTADNLRLVYRALTTSDDGQDRGFTIDEDGFVKNIEKKKLHTFLAVLLEANCSIHAVWSFTTKLVEGRTIGTAPDNHHYAGPPYSLPADRTYLKKLFDDDLETVNNFYKAQTYFSTVVLRGGENVKIQHPDISRLPWLKEDWIGSGSFGDVYKVVIAEGHFRAKDNPNKKAKVVARKDYIYEVDAKKSFEDERLAMDKIFRGIVKHVNVLKSLGSLEIECNPPKFSLFMPLALEDLETYMNANNDTAHVALDADARRRLIRSAFGLADGLQYLHQGITTPEGDKLVCYHMDLKPGNILLFKDDRVARENPHDDDRIWKVSDFGMSRVKARQTSTERDKELDLRKLFRSNVKPQQNQASATRNRRGKGTYLPSEAAKDTKEMDHKSDIWSLGCVISELFTYMEEGSKGLDAYGERRLGRSEMDADVFYERRKFRHDFGINSEVQSQHKRLIKAASRRNPAERNAVEYMLEFLERNVLRTDKSKRCNAVDVADHLRETRNKYQIRGLEKAVSAPRWLNSFKLPRSVKPAVPQNVEQWRLLIDKTTSLKGCESSPDGTVIVYWSDSKICVFFGPAGASDEKTHFESGSDSRSDSISRSEEAGLIPVERGPPDEQGQSWRSVKLTKRYLIAVTKGGDFNCYIFDIEAASNLTRYSVVPLGHPEVHMFAVSPDEKTIVGILANHAGGTRGSLFTANISQPWASAQLEDYLATPVQSNTDAGIQLTEEMLFPLDWPAKETIHLTLLSGRKGFITTRSQSHSSSLSIDLFCTPSARSVETTTIALKPEHADNTHARSFTDMACYPSEDRPEAIVVVQGEHLCKIQFPALNRKLNFHPWRIESHRILKVAIDRNLGRIFALGTRSGKRNIFLLHVQLPGPGQTKVQEEAELPGLVEFNELKLRICSDSRGDFALVTAITPVGRDSVYYIVLGRSLRLGP